MSPLHTSLADGVRVVVSTTSDGDQRNELARRRLIDRPFALVHQVHGVTVVAAAAAIAEEPDADAVVSLDGEAVLAVRGADCALIALAGDNGAIAVAHAGWRGLFLGVVEAAIDSLRGVGADKVRAVLGPHIGPECYEFSDADLAPIADRYGDVVVGRTHAGATALDLGAGVGAALASREVELVGALGGCGGCDEGFYSWRARKDNGRHLLGAYRI